MANPSQPVDRSVLLGRALHHSPPDLEGGPFRHIIMTPEDVAQGVRGGAVDCPIAVVLVREVSWIVSVNLAGPQPTFTDTFGLEHNLSLPPDVVEWIGRFDRGEAVDPLNLIVGS